MVSHLTLGRLEPQACLVEQDEPCGSVPLGLWDLLEFPASLPRVFISWGFQGSPDQSW